MSHHEEDGLESYLRQLAAVVEAANSSAGTAGVASALAEAQRVAAWGLREAVRLGRERGLSWRQLAELLDIPASTLHRQYRSGAAILTTTESPPELPGAPPSASRGTPPAYDVFVGRERELADLSALVHQARLLTVIGPVGVGKTRLAAELARRVEPTLPGGVTWVDLAPVTKPWHVATAVGATDRFADAGAALLVLDNCEHVIDAVAEVVAKLRAAAPELHILATSREALRTPGETVTELEPLRADAVRLFSTRAREVNPGFDPDPHAVIIAEICDRLDGLPLAIELAAHHLDVLTPEALLSGPPARLDLLVDGRRGAIGHRRGLRDAIRWSYDLLDDREQQVFARLSVLPGGFDQRSAAAVTADLGLTRPQLWALLASLARKSMIATDPRHPGRFRMLQSLRAYGEAVLVDAGGLGAAQNLLLNWLAAFELRLRDSPRGDDLTIIEHQVVAELDNLHHGVTVAAAGRHPAHPALALLLARFLANVFDLTEVGRLLADVLDDPATPPLPRAHALVWLAKNDARRGDHDAAIRHSTLALELARGLDDVGSLALALTSVMMTRGNTGDLPGGIRAGQELIALLRQRDRAEMTGQILTKQAWLLMASGDLVAAREAITESMRLFEAGADPSLPPAARFANHYGMTLLHNAAMTAVLQRDDVAAAEYLTAVLTMPVPDRDYVLGAIECAAVLAARRKKYTLALTLIAGTTSVGHPVHARWERQLQATTEAARRALGPSAARDASADGSAMTVAQLIDLALTGDPLLDEDVSGALTRRELAVARRVADGLTNAHIAKELHVSTRTVAGHLANIRRKLGVRGRVEVALWAARNSNPLS
ncbi:ATP-binding protein [Paractinoplanes lichenicola]|uniref:AAA family ATPase n=1 Tax=Paractinoplanes lichenicola TaxID=2802976 RepID=A0ABS1VEK5_9ACTN|nr:LuxR C-terminal-related transcriptional regulator [Actinoplanes lichenicola]MBL7253114.1 AAA family ATPase [Actinoplanes lichenicola]